MRWLFGPLCYLLLLSGQAIPLVAQDRGNTSAQEYGDAVYSELRGIAGFFGYDYNHTAVFAGLNSGHDARVMQAFGSGYVTHEGDFNDQFTSHGSYYYGAYTLDNRAMSFTDRRNVVTTAISLVNAAIDYPSTILPPVCLVYYGSSYAGTIADISNIRCDGFVEYCYEKNNFRVWRNRDYVDSTWSIVLYPDLHNDRPDNTRNPDLEASPWAQRGAPCSTGPIPGFGCGYALPDTKLNRAAAINLPTFQATQVSGLGYVDVTMRATDESGIHIIGCIKPGETDWTLSPTQPQHPTSDSYSWTVRITNSGTLRVAAIDNGNNKGNATYTINVLPPDSVRPTVSITNPATTRTYTNSQTVTIFATAADNVGVTRVEFYEGSTNRSTDTTPPYSHDWAFDSSNNGAHVWTARAYDAAGNSATSSPVTLTVSIDITPPAVAITSPANGANVTAATITALGTASDPGSPSSGLGAVEVRVNGGNWQTAGGTASWSRSVTLSPCPNSIEARSRDRAGNYSLIASNFVTYTPPNTPPSIPVNLSPPSGATDLSLTPILEAGPFSDSDCVGDTHASSQWQVLNSTGTVIVWASGETTTNKTAVVVPSGRLRYASNYVWKVRYRDSRGAWSTAYSPTTGFRTVAPTLSGVKQGTNMVFRWSTNALGFTLQRSTNLGTAGWSNATPAPMIVSGQYTVTNSMTNSFRFYRLRR